MAIRIRTVNSVRVALCAAETDECPGDLYLDDADHYALAAKFNLDYNTGIEYIEHWSVMESQRKRDAQEECEKWDKNLRYMGDENT